MSFLSLYKSSKDTQYPRLVGSNRPADRQGRDHSSAQGNTAPAFSDRAFVGRVVKFWRKVHPARIGAPTVKLTVDRSVKFWRAVHPAFDHSVKSNFSVFAESSYN